jgi:hypothetical protein
MEKSVVMPSRGKNLLPQALETVICRFNRKRGIAFATLPIKN